MQRTAVLIIPAKHLLDGAGAAAVCRQEFIALRSRGWQVDVHVIAPTLRPPLAGNLDGAMIKAAIQRLGAEACSVHAAIAPWRAPVAFSRLLMARITGRWTIASDLAIADVLSSLVTKHFDAAMPPSRLDDRVKPQPDIVICNYLSGLSLADALAPRQRQIIVLHDAPAGTWDRSVATALRERPHLIALTADDASHIERLTGGMGCEVASPIEVGLPLSASDVVGITDMAGLMAACGPARNPGPVPSHGIDLLFVGGAHPPNVEGLSRFVSDSFVPHLAARGVTLAVAGDVGPALWPHRAAPHGVVVLGRVDNLRPLYAASRLVIVPLLSGTGVSIKTLEAIAIGKPVLASPVGVRGLDPAARPLSLAPPFDRRWSVRIMELLDHPGSRHKLHSALVSCLPRQTVFQALELLIQRIDPCLAEEGPMPARPDRHMAGRALVEWSAVRV